MLADVTEMPRSALLAIYREAQFHSRLPALLSRGTSVSERICEPLELSLMLALAYLSVLRRSISLFEILFASAANEPSADEPSMAPLLVTRLLRWMFLALLSGRQIFDSEW